MGESGAITVGRGLGLTELTVKSNQSKQHRHAKVKSTQITERQPDPLLPRDTGSDDPNPLLNWKTSTNCTAVSVFLKRVLAKLSRVNDSVPYLRQTLNCVSVTAAETELKPLTRRPFSVS